MEVKINIPLIDRISAALSKLATPPKKREETTETSFESFAASLYYKKIKIERTRKAKYIDYLIMDEEYPEISTALDLYADNATKEKGKTGNAIEVKSKNPRVQNIIDELLDRTKIHETLWDTARNLSKMGDEFDEVVVDSEGWIDRLKPLEPAMMHREVDEYGRDAEKPYVQKDESGTVSVAQFEKWQVVHWRNGGQKKLYGESVMKSIRRVYKQLQMMEDGMVIGRLTRSHLRYKILVDVDGLDREERKSYVEDVKRDFKKKRLVNPVTGQLETTQNPLCLTGDTRISLLGGRELTICELMSKFKEDETFWVYASDGVNTVPALATRPWKSGVNAGVVEVKLDNGSSVKCTPSHRFMMRDGTWKKANDLCPGDSLMPLYRRLARRRDCDGRFLPNVQMVSNHKVISVGPCGCDDVYDLKVEKYHCLAVSAGVIVHNSAEEDFFLGVTKESKADVNVLQGATNLGNIRDVEYFQTKLFAGLKVPKAFVGLEKDVKAKATIVEEDIQFARTVGRIRKALRTGLIQVIDYQLILRGISPTKGLYEISFEPISMVDEMRKWTMEKLKADVAKIYRVDMQILGDEFILRTFLGLPDEVIAAVLKDKPAPLTSPSPKKATTPSLRAAGATGMTTPQVGGLNPKAMVSQGEDGSNGLDRSDGFHIATLQMMNLVETLRDLVDLEINR